MTQPKMNIYKYLKVKLEILIKVFVLTDSECLKSATYSIVVQSEDGGGGASIDDVLATPVAVVTTLYIVAAVPCVPSWAVISIIMLYDEISIHGLPKPKSLKQQYGIEYTLYIYRLSTTTNTM